MVRRITWFLRKAAASSLEHHLVCTIRSLHCRVLVCRAADTASLATRFLFGKLFAVAITFGFGEKRCRKNLPLYDLRFLDARTFTASPNTASTTGPHASLDRVMPQLRRIRPVDCGSIARNCRLNRPVPIVATVARVIAHRRCCRVRGFASLAVRERRAIRPRKNPPTRMCVLRHN